MENSASSENHALQTQLPIARVKKIFRLDLNCTTISAEAVQLLTFATERFIGLLAKVAYRQAVFDKRKTLQLRDLEFCIKNCEPFNFLDGTLDGWPEISGGKHGNGSSVTMAAERSEEFVFRDADEEQKDLNVDANGLSNEIFGLEETEPFDGQSAEKPDNTVTVKKTEIVNDFVREIQSLELKVFGHYGYYLPMNSIVSTLI
uniref:CBFD_NFYB_HMF domain-containing protein n=1 Tax=Elaeophora elaphi TaxID=1147741 RepID=A0A0R3RZ59_9BILA